ncbi:branched-chain amino acid ABC transporter substrate-binding protein [Ramlibacter sp. 2FC]|uniref:branched-chain amino acid ABC transporter substrate-binding protein n=1 Tax=Ramlibacter sp. 2FC TaxID=2502188 RepID=UPI0010F83F54|nr:branched-chain amino acid ABC transporter substrate-binding protein [Ramlibacter sp. 2FC]
MQHSFRAKRLLASTALALAGAAWAQDSLTVRIGQVGPTSGPAAHLGLDNVNGARLAIDDLNARDVRIGGRKARFELIAEDDAADPKQGTQAAQKLCDQKINGVVGHLTSGSTIPASKVYNDCGIPHISPVATNPRLTEQGFKTSFRLLASDNAMGVALAHFAAAGLKLRKVAVVDDRTAYGQGVAAVFKKTAQKLGLQVVDEQFTHDKSVDFSSILTAIKAKGAEAIFYGGLDAQAGPMLRQMQMLGMGQVRLFGGDGICTTRLAELAGSPDNLAQVTCGEGGASVDKMHGGAAWKQRYDARFAGQFQGSSPYAYDAVMVLVEAMKKAGSPDPKVYGPALFNTDYQGVTARIAFDATGELASPALTLFQYRGGKKAPLN